MSNKIEQRSVQQHQTAALAEVKTQYPKYFEALEKHPRALVGQRVPAASPEEPGQDKDGFVVLKDSSDAKEWQEATRQHIVGEVRTNAARRAESNGGDMQTLHQSIELFQNNSDLVPGTKQFDRELADEFAAIASSYEVRKDGKLQGYSIQVQPLIDRLRTQIAAKRTAAPAASNVGAPASTPSTAGAPAQPAEQPQAGIQSKSGNSTEGENYDALWGTLGLGGIRV